MPPRRRSPDTRGRFGRYPPLWEARGRPSRTRTCQPAARRSRRRPRGRRVYRGRGSTVEALPRLRKRKLWPIMAN